jgi:hypothetical protein
LPERLIMFVANTELPASHLTFGHQAAQFKELLAIMTVVSIIMWSVVLLTIAARMVLCHIWYRQSRMAHTENLPIN